MVKAQDWLDKNYPKEERGKVRLISINRKDLEGELKLEDFSNLERIDCNENKLDSLQFTNCPKLTRVYCYGNKLTSLKITGCPKISHLNVSCNFFNNFDFLNDLDSKRLVYLSIHTNNLPESDLSIFSDFTNLEELYVDNYDKERFDKGIYNRFHGSLEALKELKKLRWLNIGGTDINSGLEHLPLNLKKIGCNSSSIDKKSWKCLEIEKELKEITRIADTDKESTKEGENDTKWTKDWYRFTQWSQVKEWEKKGFGRQEIRQWMNVGLRLDELDFAVYLKEKNYAPFTFKKEVKIWLDWKYLQEERNNIKELNISHKNLSGELDLSNFTNLRELDCSDNKLTNLNLSKCNELTLLNISNNNFSEQKDLKFLESFTKLESISLANNRFCGSLEPLKNMSNLRELNIVDTDINSGLEFLPSGLERFYCAGEQKNNAKVKQIFEQLSNYGREGRYNLQVWKENNNAHAQKWLDKEYPEDDICKRKSDRKNEGKRREEIIILDISDQGLKGKLKLEGFDKLEKLNCSGNQLTSLDLSNCEKLQRLNCSDNQFTSTNFLINLRKPNKLVKLDIGNNSKIFRQNLDFLTSFTGLEELNLENCPFKGNLEPIKGLNELKKICISNTNIEEGLEYLPESCKRFYCDRNGKGKSAKIVKELGKYLKNDEDKSNAEYYDLVKWKEDKQNGIALIIPLERLYVIKSNMKRFYDKWGEKGDNKDSEWWKFWEKIEVLWEKKGSDNLSRLQSPEEYEKYWYAVIPQWTSRAAAVGGGILAINDNYNQIGGAIGIASAFFETVFSRAKEDLYDAKERKWEEFIRDAESLWNSCDELIGILEPIHIQVSSSGEALGKVNKAIKELNDNIFGFLGGEAFDKNHDGKINYSEWKEMMRKQTRNQLTEKLRECWESSEGEKKGKKNDLENVIEVMRLLEEEIIKYRQYHHHWASEKDESVDNQYSSVQLENAEEKNSSEFSSNNRNWWKLLRKNYLWGREDENEREIPSKEKSNLNSEKEIQEWFTILDLSSQEKEFIYWLKEEKCKDMENFADPQWVKNNADLNELRQEYQQWQEEKDDVQIQIEQPLKSRK